MKHTPGPWACSGPSYDNRLPVKITEIVADWSSDDDYSPTICEMPPNDGDEEIEANARLIAAAPDLLDALIKALDVLVAAKIGYVDQDKAQIAIEEARHAIAEATGNSLAD